MHQVLLDGFLDELEKLGQLDPVDLVDPIIPADPWARKQEFAYQQAKKLAKGNPVLLERMLHEAKLEAMQQGAERAQASPLKRGLERGSISLDRPRVRPIQQHMLASIQAGDPARRRPQLLLRELELFAPQSRGEQALASSGAQMGLGGWLRSILARKHQASRAVRALLTRGA